MKTERSTSYYKVLYEKNGKRYKEYGVGFNCQELPSGVHIVHVHSGGRTTLYDVDKRKVGEEILATIESHRQSIISNLLNNLKNKSWSLNDIVDSTMNEIRIHLEAEKRRSDAEIK